MSLRIVPLPIEQAKVPVFRVVCSRAPKALASQDTWILRGAACRRVVPLPAFSASLLASPQVDAVAVENANGGTPGGARHEN